MRQQIGLKRNTACDLAAGEIIVHWDETTGRAGIA